MLTDVCLVKQRQMVQNAAAQVDDQPKVAHVTPSADGAPLATCIQLKSLILTYRAPTGSAPSNFSSPVGAPLPSFAAFLT